MWQKVKSALLYLSLIVDNKDELSKNPGSIGSLKFPGPDVTAFICDFLSLKETVSLASSCSLFRENLQTKIIKRKVDRLVEYVLKGNFAKVESMLQREPELVLEKGRAMDYSGRQIEGTAFQAALGAEDPEIYEWMADHCFNRLRDRDGREEMLKQYHEQFPALGEEKEDSAEESPDIVELREIARVIGASNNDQECEDALQRFHDYLKPQGIIRTGKHFNAELFYQACQLYADNYNNFGGPRSRKNHLFCCKVIGYIQRLFPACYAQAFSQGLYGYLEGEPLARSFCFVYEPKYFFFPLSSKPTGLGYDYMTCSGKHDIIASEMWWEHFDGKRHFQRLCQIKTAALQNLCADRPIQNRAAL